MKATTTNPSETAQYRIRIVHDNSPSNPFEDWDCEYPLMYESGRNNTDGKDFSKGETDDYLKCFLTTNQIVYHQKKIWNMVEDFGYRNIDDAEDNDDKIEIITDSLHSFIDDSIDNKVQFCQEFGIPYYSAESRGYSQGDWAKVLIVPTPKNAEKIGYDLKKISKENMKSSFDLFTNWAWGDVYGFIIEEKRQFTKTYSNGDEIEDEEWEEVDSCWGFYGRNGAENGMTDNIDYQNYGWTKEQLIEMINDAEVEY